MIHNYATCGGPRHCQHCEDILSETAEDTHKRLTAEDRERELRAASDGSWQLRTNVHLWEDGPMKNDYTEARRTTSAPDPYFDGIAKLRTAQGITLDAVADDDPRLKEMVRHRAAFYGIVSTSRAAAAQPAVGDVYTNPPDPYAIALKKEAR